MSYQRLEGINYSTCLCECRQLSAQLGIVLSFTKLKVMLVNTSPQPPTGLWDVLGWSLWCSGFLLEAVLAPGQGKAGIAPGCLDPCLAGPGDRGRRWPKVCLSRRSIKSGTLHYDRSMEILATSELLWGNLDAHLLHLELLCILWWGVVHVFRLEVDWSVHVLHILRFFHSSAAGLDFACVQCTSPHLCRQLSQHDSRRSLCMIASNFLPWTC